MKWINDNGLLSSKNLYNYEMYKLLFETESKELVICCT